jgi:PEGA domain
MCAFRSAGRFHCNLLFLMSLLTVVVLRPAHGQGLELNGGWTHITGDFGTNGFNAGAAWWFTRQVTIAGEYESSWNTSNLSTFAFTQVGPIVVKSHLQSATFGPRIFFAERFAAKYKLHPFGEAEFGFSHLRQQVTQLAVPTEVASDTAFAWLAGGGVEYMLSHHWSARGNLDFMRTYFANAGQSRLRLIIGVTYTFGSREIKPLPAKHTIKAPAGERGESHVHVTSNPSGAEIYIDGNLYGNTPSDLTLPAGQHVVRIALNGKEWTRTVQITTGDIDLTADLNAQ